MSTNDPEEAQQGAQAKPISVGPLTEDELPSADRIMRLAFGTFIGLPDPLTFMGDADYVHTRWRANPDSAFGARIDGELAGSNFATRWGSVGFFGPLTVDPRFWDRSVGSRLLEPVMACFDAWGTTMTGLCTFPQSAKHIGLYQKFGFWPRFLTAVMAKSVPLAEAAPERNGEPGGHFHWSRVAEAPTEEHEALIVTCRELTNQIYPGLDVQTEIRSIQTQGLGDTVLLWEGEGDAQLAGVAVCHYGAGSEAGSGACYIKFGAARPGPRAQATFAALLDACTALAAERGLPRLTAGVNTARHEAYRTMLAGSFRLQMQSIIMQRGDDVGYNHPGIYLIDDWR